VGTAIDVQVNASDSDGSVTLVELFEGSHLIGSATSSPVHITWTPAEPGVYSLRAVATDNAGASVSSSPITVFITSSSSTKSGP
jgi:chitinase